MTETQVKHDVKPQEGKPKAVDPKAVDAEPKEVPPNPTLDAIQDQPPLDKPTAEDQDLTLDWGAAVAVLDALETDAIDIAAEMGAEGINPHVYIRNTIEPFRQAIDNGNKTASIHAQIMAMEPEDEAAVAEQKKKPRELKKPEVKTNKVSYESKVQEAVLK